MDVDNPLACDFLAYDFPAYDFPAYDFENEDEVKRLVASCLANPSDETLAHQGEDRVQLHIGPKPIRLSLHRDLLCQVSPVFRAAYTGNFREAIRKILPLPETDMATAFWFVKWLYQGEPPATTTTIHQEVQLVRLVIFGDMYHVPALRQQSLLWLHDSWAVAGPKWQAVCELWHGLPDTSPVRQYIVDIIAYGGWYLRGSVPSAPLTDDENKENVDPIDDEADNIPDKQHSESQICHEDEAIWLKQVPKLVLERVMFENNHARIQRLPVD